TPGQVSPGGSPNGLLYCQGPKVLSPRPVFSMSEVARILSAIEQGDAYAAEKLLPLVYEELRTLAVKKLAQERPGQTLQATALVHMRPTCGCWAVRRTHAGTAAAILSLRPPRPCAASSSSPPGASSASSTAAAASGNTRKGTLLARKGRSGCRPCMKPW